MAIQLADGRYVMSRDEEETYLQDANNLDVVVAISKGQFKNASDHFNRYGINEGRGGSPDTENLETSVVDSSGFLYTNNMDINNPLADPLYRELTGSPDPVGGGTAGGGTAGGGTAGGGTAGGGTAGGGGIMSGSLDPVLNRIGTPTVTNPNLFQGQAALSQLMGTGLENQNTITANQGTLEANQQGISDKIGVAPVTGAGVPGEGPTTGTLFSGQAGLQSGQADIQAGIGQAGEGQTDLFAGQRGIMSGIGTAGTDTTPGTGLVGGQANIQAGIGTAGEGQTDLFAGQAGLATGQQAMQATQAGLEAGQLGLGQQIGTAAVTNEQGEVTQQPTGLYAGQAGLMSGQTGLTQDVSGLSRDLSGIGDQLSGDLSGLGSQLGAFRTAAEQYQRGATTQRGDIQGTQRAGQAALTAQVQGVGQQANRAAEMMAQQRQQQQQPAVQQQAAQFARSAPRATTSNQQVGPMGPMATDPRDAIMQQLMANRTGLMNRGPV